MLVVTNKPLSGLFLSDLVAQKFEAVLTESVVTNKDGVKPLKYTEIIPILAGAIKELSEKIDNK